MDNTAPAGSYTLSNTGIVTSGTVTITVTGTDSNSGMKQITKPDNTVSAGASTTYAVSKNGTYTFVLADNAGNTAAYTVTVNNIFTTSFNYIMAIPANNLNYTIDLPVTGMPAGTTFTYNFLADWGDGKTSTVTSQASAAKTHAYAAAGNYTVKIYGIAQGGIRFTNEARLKQLLNQYPSAMNVTQTDFTDFFDCLTVSSGLTGSIPAGLFDYTPNAASFNSTFKGCSGLTGAIPAGLFNNTPNVTNFNITFSECSGLTSIPAGLFDKTTAVTSFYATFDCCSGLTSIPAGLFNNTPNVTTFYDTFGGCSGLTSIPAGLFDKTLKVTNFGCTFAYCSKLTGTAPTLWTRTTAGLSGSMCFTSCTKLTNYASIPAGWK